MLFDGMEVDVEKLLEIWNIDTIDVGNELVGDCPWRNHKTGGRKFYINKGSGLWDCKACGDKQGNLIQLVALMEEIDYSDAFEFIKDRANEIDLDTLPERIAEILHGEEGRIRTRSVKQLREETEKVISKFAVGVQTDFWQGRGFGTYDVRQWRLAYNAWADDGYRYLIPVMVNDSPIYYIKRSSSSNIRIKYMYQRGFPKSEILFGMELSEHAPIWILVEGPLDAVRVSAALRRRHLDDQYGVVAVLGNHLSETQARIIHGYADEVILFFDNDKAGKEAVEATKKTLGEGILTWTVSYDAMREYYKDPGDMNDKQIVKMIESRSI